MTCKNQSCDSCGGDTVIVRISALDGVENLRIKNIAAAFNQKACRFDTTFGVMKEQDGALLVVTSRNVAEEMRVAYPEKVLGIFSNVQNHTLFGSS